ncbi:hypothetical protein AB4511_26590, partial [Vibrio sp. 10N.222.54.F6]
WATLYREDRGWGFSEVVEKEQVLDSEIKGLTETVRKLEQRLAAVEGVNTATESNIPVVDAVNITPEGKV